MYQLLLSIETNSKVIEMIYSKEILNSLKLEKLLISDRLFTPKIDSKIFNNSQKSSSLIKKEDYIEKRNSINTPITSNKNGLFIPQSKLTSSPNSKIKLTEIKKVIPYTGNARKWVLTDEEKNSYGDRFPEEYIKLDFLGRHALIHFL